MSKEFNEVDTIIYENMDYIDFYEEPIDAKVKCNNKENLTRSISKTKNTCCDKIELDEEDLIEDIKQSVEEHNCIDSDKKDETKQSKEDLIDELKEDENKAKSFILSCKNYLTSKDFNQKCFRLSKLYQVDEKKIAETFAQKVLGTIGDTLGIVINVAYNACRFLINLLSKLLFSTCGIIFTIASKLTSFFTFGYTCAE